MRVPIVAVGILAPILPALLCLAPHGQCDASAPKTMRIGVSESLVGKLPDRMRKAILIPFNSLMKSQIGMPCESAPVKDTIDAGKQLENGSLDFAVLNGFEFAWIHERFPKLKPVAIVVVGNQPNPVACLVSHEKAAFSGFEDLSGKTVSLPRRTRPHVHLFLEREGTKNGSYTFEMQRHASISDALDDVVRGKVDGVVVDGASMSAYRLLKHGCYKKLKIVKKSPSFPAAVIIYRDGGVDRKVVDRFRSKLLTAHKQLEARILMSLWRLTSFDAIPDDYGQSLRRIEDAYPLRP